MALPRLLHGMLSLAHAGLLALLASFGASKDVINVRSPVLGITNLNKGNVSARVIIRIGEPPESLAAAACRHLEMHGAGGCEEGESAGIAQVLQKFKDDFEALSPGKQIMKQVHFGWDLLLSHSAAEEARLQFFNALSAVPGSPFLLTELAAAATLAAALPTGGHGNGYFWGKNGTWAHAPIPKADDLAKTFDGWEGYASVRFRRPRKFLSEDEPDLLAAGMPPHGFVPSGEMSPDDGTASLVGAVLRHRIRHDLELVALLEQLALLPASTAKAASAAYQRVLQGAEQGDGGVLRPSEDQWHGLYPFHNRRLYIHPSPRLSAPALRPLTEERVALVHSEGKGAGSRAGSALAGGGVLVIDDLLTPEALASLRDFAELSTVWYQERASYLGAALSTGFSSPLLAQIAEELRVALREVLCDLPLANVWAFKFDEEMQTGINMHADDAAVNVNLWITPDDENLDVLTGGLTIFDASVDGTGNYSFKDYNSHSDQEGESLQQKLVRESGGGNLSVTYRQNRAVVFDSARIHTTQPLTFRKGRGLRSRRINITFLFGARGAYCPLRRVAEVALVPSGLA